MNEWVWSIDRIILTGKNQNTPRKPWPSATLSTTNPIRTGLHANPGVCGERSRTNSHSHLPTLGKVTYDYFLLYRSVPMCCIIWSMCYIYRLCTVWEVIQQKLPHSCSVWSWPCLPNIAYPIFGRFSLISSIHHYWLRNSLTKLPKTACSDGI